MRVKKLHNFGNHFILDGFSKVDLSDIRFISDLLLDLPKEIGMKAISDPIVLFHESDDKMESGVTGTIILAESNITIHTYPNKKWFALDIFSCKEFDVDFVFNILKNKLQIVEYRKKILKRGFYEKD